MRKDYILLIVIIGTVLSAVEPGSAMERRPTQEEIIRAMIDDIEPLKHPRGDRIPMRGSRLENWLPENDNEAREVLMALDARGIGMSYRVRHFNEENLAAAVRMGRLQQELGLPVSVHASSPLYGFFNGDEDTFHIAEDGTPFFDDSFSSRKMGCPFRLEHRKEDIKKQMRSWLDAYDEAGVTVDFIYFDWEIDGPIEWNGAWEQSKQCTVCLDHVPDLAVNFYAFQDSLRAIRSDLQRECAVELINDYYPDALVGNYAVYPNNGVRYWYDYFEYLPEGAPWIGDQKARYRRWYSAEFEEAGYTFANPTVYTWYPTWSWYPEFDNDDYRWFYNMLLVASNAGRHTPKEVPLISWVHWHTTVPPEDGGVAPQMSEWAYQELLSHMFLRGTESLMMWCRPEETVKEVLLMQDVYDATGEWHDFLAGGTPKLFDVPRAPGSVISAVRHENKLLVRRTDFSDNPDAVIIEIDGMEVSVPRRDGEFQLIELP